MITRYNIDCANATAVVELVYSNNINNTRRRQTIYLSIQLYRHHGQNQNNNNNIARSAVVTKWIKVQVLLPLHRTGPLKIENCLFTTQKLRRNSLENPPIERVDHVTESHNMRLLASQREREREREREKTNGNFPT